MSVGCRSDCAIDQHLPLVTSWVQTADIYAQLLAPGTSYIISRCRCPNYIYWLRYIEIHGMRLNARLVFVIVVCCLFDCLFAGLPDQGFEDSDNSSIFSSPSPKSRQRTTAACLADVAQSSLVQLRQQTAADKDVSMAVMGVQRQASHVPVGGRNVSSASELARPRSVVLSFPDETCTGELAGSNNGQVLNAFFHTNLHINIFSLVYWY